MNGISVAMPRLAAGNTSVSAAVAFELAR